MIRTYILNCVIIRLETKEVIMKFKKINIKESMDHYNVSGITISLIKNGQLNMTHCLGLLETRTKNNLYSNTIFNTYSISKFLTIKLVIKLIKQGLNVLDEDVKKMISSWTNSGNDLT